MPCRAVWFDVTFSSVREGILTSAHNMQSLIAPFDEDGLGRQIPIAQCGTVNLSKTRVIDVLCPCGKPECAGTTVVRFSHTNHNESWLDRLAMLDKLTESLRSLPLSKLQLRLIEWTATTVTGFNSGSRIRCDAEHLLPVVDVSDKFFTLHDLFTPVWTDDERFYLRREAKDRIKDEALRLHHDDFGEVMGA